MCGKGRRAGPAAGKGDIRMILALLPFLVLGQMPLMVLQAMRARGIPVAIATYHPTPTHYTGDAAVDFRGDDMLLDMHCHATPADSAMLEEIVDRIGARMIVQAGAPAAYAQLARLRERRPDIRQMDWIFNTGPHFRRLSDRPTSFDAVLACGKAWNKDPAEGVIGVQTGPLWRWGSRWFLG